MIVFVTHVACPVPHLASITVHGSSLGSANCHRVLRCPWEVGGECFCEVGEDFLVDERGGGQRKHLVALGKFLHVSPVLPELLLHVCQLPPHEVDVRHIRPAQALQLNHRALLDSHSALRGLQARSQAAHLLLSEEHIRYCGVGCSQLVSSLCKWMAAGELEEVGLSVREQMRSGQGAMRAVRRLGGEHTGAEPTVQEGAPPHPPASVQGGRLPTTRPQQPHLAPSLVQGGDELGRHAVQGRGRCPFEG
mmetsp:Transcript_6645/g.19424  ORF Transcript_6645/g.19424 Transcript_6645/m.19424 type:complete len:249 (+) Transcript_6645:273-1019(+)